MTQPKRSKAGKPGRADDAEEVRDSLVALRERLLHSLTLPIDRLQETADDAVRRGRMTRQDAEDLVAALVSTGRSQTEALLSDLEQLLGRNKRDLDPLAKSAAAGKRVARSSGEKVERVLREVERARRAVSGGFPIEDYDDLTAAKITARLSSLTPAELRKVRDYERRNANRKSVLGAVEKALK